MLPPLESDEDVAAVLSLLLELSSPVLLFLVLSLWALLLLPLSLCVLLLLVWMLALQLLMPLTVQCWFLRQHREVGGR